MKLYHIDRSGHIKSGDKIEIKKDFYTEVTENEYFKDGLSSHGIHYYLAEYQSKSYGTDIIFEYERMINYPEKLSRYQSFYAFDEEGVVNFVEKWQLEDIYFQIYEVDFDYYERYNFNLVRGWSHCSASKYAKLYWENGEDPNKERKPIYEYLLKLPVTIGKETDLSEIKKVLKKKEPTEKEVKED